MDYEKTNSMEGSRDSPQHEMEKQPMDIPGGEIQQSVDPDIAHSMEDGEVDMQRDWKSDDEDGKHGHVLVGWLIIIFQDGR